MILERVIAILFKPKETWSKIKDEPTDFNQVFINYALPLAAIPAIFGLLGSTIVGIRYGFGAASGVFRIPFFHGLISAVVAYVLTLVGLMLEGVIVNALAPSFGSKQNFLNSFKLAVYTYTPIFLIGVLRIIPSLMIVVYLISLYSIYLLYLGLPIMMETPKDKSAGYIVVTIIVYIIIYIIIGAISGLY